jgi:hypothetical protein
MEDMTGDYGLSLSVLMVVLDLVLWMRLLSVGSISDLYSLLSLVRLSVMLLVVLLSLYVMLYVVISSST